MVLLHTNIFYQYLVNYLSNSIMHLFFLIQNLLLLIFCMNDLLSISLSHTLKALVPYRYVVNLSKVCNLLSWLLLSAIVLIFSVYTSCASLWNLCCGFSLILFLNKQSFWSLNESILFITHLFILSAFYYYQHHLLNKNMFLV